MRCWAARAWECLPDNDRRDAYADLDKQVMDADALVDILGLQGPQQDKEFESRSSHACESTRITRSS